MQSQLDRSLEIGYAISRLVMQFRDWTLKMHNESNNCVDSQIVQGIYSGVSVKNGIAVFAKIALSRKNLTLLSMFSSFPPLIELVI